MKLSQVLALAVAFAAVGFSGARACQLVQVGELPVIIKGRQALVDAEINGRPAQLLLDSGAPTMLFRSSAQPLGLVVVPLRDAKLYGVGGGDVASMARIPTLKIGSLVARDFDVYVSGRSFSNHLAGVLGAAFIYQADVEFDFPDGKVKFWRPKGCTGDQVVYWGSAYAVAPIAPSNGDNLELQVRLNGVPIRAMLDTGAGISVVTTGAAQQAGAALAPADAASGAKVRGFSGQVAVETTVFPTFGVGEETIRHASLRVADLFGAETEVHLGSHIPTAVIDTPQMLLGFDFLRAHRLYVARDQKKVYASYVGGPVFETPAATAPPAASKTATGAAP